MFRIFCFLLTTTCIVCNLSGCQTTTPTSLPFFRSSDPYAEQRVALVHRAYTDHYKKTGADEALAWLLYNGVRGGMTIKDIEKVMGQPLETTEPGNEFETSFGIEESDTFYQIGPTSNDWTCLFHFREGKLLTYHPISPETIADTNEDEISVN